MNIELHILVGQPRGTRKLKVIGSYDSRSEMVAARKKVKPADFVFIGEINTNGTHLKNRRHFATPVGSQPATPAPATPPPQAVPATPAGATLAPATIAK